MIGVELRKQLPRTRTWVSMLIMAVVPVVMTIGFAVGGTPHDHGDQDLFRVATSSGLNMPLAALSAMETFLLVVVVSVFAGETVAGESNWGTLRYLLVRPVRRSRLLTAKLVVAALLVVLAVVTIVAVGLAAGVPAFGWHPFRTPFGFTIGQGTALIRLLAAAGYVAWSMSSVVAFAFFLSSIIDSPFGAVFGGLAFAILSEILDAISALGNVRYAFPTHYWHSWENLFAFPSNGSDMVPGTLLQIPYVVVFLGLAYYFFFRRDVLS